MGIHSRVRTGNCIISLFGRFSQSRYLPICIGLLGIVLTAPSLRLGLLADDYWHRAIMTRSPRFAQFLGTPLDAFRFVNADPEKTRAAMDAGLLPWWTWPKTKGAFWRPITSLTHWLDYQLWPETPALMHAQSILIYGLLCAAVTVYFRRLHISAGIAALAAILYCVDNNHTICAAWLAGRNTILATLFGVLALIAHDRWRRNHSVVFAPLACLALLASLLSAEAGIAVCAFLFSYAIFIDTASIRKRVLTLVPYALIVIVWRIAWIKLGYGIDGIEIYSDPIRNTADYFLAIFHRAPILLFSQWALLPADIAILLTPKQIAVYASIAAVLLAVLFVLFLPILRGDRIARFWFLSMLLALLPICASFPTARLLTFVGIAGAGLLGRYLHFVFVEVRSRPQKPRWYVPAFTIAALLGFIHLLVSPAVMLVSSRFPMGSDELTTHLSVHLNLDASAAEQDVIIVNPPIALGASYVPVTAETHNTAIPRRFRILAPGYAKVTVYRPDAYSLIVRPEWGFLAWIGDRIFRSSHYPFQLDEKVELTGFTAHILEMTPDGRPAEVRLTFDVPLENPSLRWLQCQGNSYVPFTPPPIGDTIELASQDPVKK